MPRRSVFIVAFDGMQPLDAIGPHEVFAGATSVLAAKGRHTAGYDLALVSRHGARQSPPRVDCRSARGRYRPRRAGSTPC